MKRINLLVTAVAAVAMTAGAESPIVEQILDGNLTLSALKVSNIADIEAQRAANTLAGPEAEMEYMFGSGTENKWSVGVSQGFDWPGAYRARSKAIDAAERVGQLTYKARYQDIRYEARQLVVRYNFAMQRLELLEGMIGDLQSISEGLDTALDHGLVTILDVKKAKIELANLIIDRDKIIAEKQTIHGLMDELAGHVLMWPDDEKNIADGMLAEIGPLKDLGEYVKIATENDMNYQAALMSHEAKIADNAAMRASLAPSFSLGYRHAFEEGNHFNGFAFSIGLPSWGIKSYKHAAKAAETASMLNTYALQKSLTARIFSDYRRAAELRSRIAVMRQNGLDGTYMSLLEQAYKGGELSTLDYLREQTYYRESRLATLDLEEEYAMLLTSLNRYE